MNLRQFSKSRCEAHYNMRAVLDSPDVDVILSPMSYFERQPAAAELHAECGSVTAAENLSLEDDTRNVFSEGSTAPAGKADGTPEERGIFCCATLRESAVEFGIWWMD